MITTYVYRNESFARKIFEEIKQKYGKHVRIALWTDGEPKKIETADMLYRFIHHTKLNETYRGYKTNHIYFEPSLIHLMTVDQLNVAWLSVRREEFGYNCLTLEETLEAFRSKQ